MTLTKPLCLVAIALSSVGAFADTSTYLADSDLRLNPFGSSDKYAVNLGQPRAQAAAAAAAVLVFNRPRFGIRVGGGEWNDFVLDAGADVTWNVPFIPLPAIRLDGEFWASASDLGGDIHGNALSLLGVQTFMLGYAGLGPSYYYTDDNGNHHSGFGAKLLGGLNIPGGMFVEAGLIVGPPSVPVFVTIGWRF